MDTNLLEDKYAKLKDYDDDKLKMLSNIAGVSLTYLKEIQKTGKCDYTTGVILSCHIQ